MRRETIDKKGHYTHKKNEKNLSTLRRKYFHKIQSDQF